jgi:hypothetical protein
MSSRLSQYALLLTGLALGLACQDASVEVDPEATAARLEIADASPDARFEVVEMLREARDLTYHASDGGGRAWLESAEPARPQAGSSGRFTIVYEVGPLGIAKGGMIYLQVSPFWGWSTPQLFDAEAPGFTRIESEALGVELEAETLDRQLLGIRVEGRALAEGEQLRIVYGAGNAGATVDEYAGRRSPFWIAVDGDGDGVRKTLVESPSVDILAGPAGRLVITLPTVARPGDTVRVSVAILDSRGSAGVSFEGIVTLRDAAPVLELPERVSFAKADAGVKVIEAVVRQAGVVRLSAEGPFGLSAQSNPLVASAEGPRVLWADLHGHSGLSDGTGVPEDYFRYARDVAALDVVALTDHDHWGMLPLDSHPELWQEIVRETRRFHEPGRFVTLLGFEWTSWIHGHRHVLYFGDEGEIHSSVDPELESPLQLWQALEGKPALTFAHHSAGGPIGTNWNIPPDPRFEPVTEVVSVHGSSEALDSPTVIYAPVPGNFVRDALDRGYRLGFIGSGDSHDGHTGLAQLAAASGGLAAILSEERSREGVLEALRARRVYATNGPRILLRAALGAHRMGSTIPVPAGESLDAELFVSVVATAPLARVELIRSGERIDGLDIGGQLEATLQRTLSGLRSGEYVYVRALQEDGGAAWSSPFFIE